MGTSYLILGSNLGNRQQQLETACDRIAAEIGVITKKSAIFVTAPWGNTDQPDFYNQAIEVQSSLSPLVQLKKALAIEEKMGRTRDGNKWMARSIDIDLLFIDNQVLDLSELKIPHPFLQERRFVLEPLAAIAPEFVHPVLKKSIRQLLAACTDPLTVSSL